MSQYPPQMPPFNAPQPGYPPVQPGAYPTGGYASYPVQSGYGAVPPPRKSGAGLWIAIVIVVLLLLAGGGAAYFVFSGQSSPMATLQRYCDGNKNRNAQEIYDTFSTSMQQQHSLATLQRAAAPQNSTTSAQSISLKVDDCTVSNVQQTGSTATGTIMTTVTMTGPSSPQTATVPMPAKLVQENGQWKIDSLGTTCAVTPGSQTQNCK